MAMQETFLMIKPDKYGKLPLPPAKLYTFIRERLPEGLIIETAELFEWSPQGAGKHYEDLKDKPFYQNLIGMITSGPCFGMVVYGDDAVNKVRAWAGSKAGLEKDGTITLPEEGTLRYELPLAKLCHDEGIEYTGKVKRLHTIYDKDEDVAISAVRIGKRGYNLEHDRCYNYVHSSDGEMTKSGKLSNEVEVANFTNELLMRNIRF